MTGFAPLDDIRVLDLTRLLPGAVCTMMMMQFGAEVIKIEAPGGGDYARWMPPLVDGHGALFDATNRGKYSMILNLKDRHGQAILKRLIVDADVLIEGNRPDVMQRLNCDYESLRQINPRLIYCSLSGWGQSGPYADKSGHDLNYVAGVGLLGDNTAGPPGGQIADIGGAYAAINAILAALLHREHAGDGAYLDVSLFESSLMFALQPLVEALTAPLHGIKLGLLTGGFACYNTYRSQDRVVVTLAALEEKFWINFAHAVDRPDLLEGDYMAADRQVHLMQELTDLFASRPAAQWQNQLAEADCCFAVSTPIAAVVDDPHLQARGRIHVDENGVPLIRVRPDTDTVNERRPPRYGEHTRQFLSAAGYDEHDIDALLADGVIGA